LNAVNERGSTALHIAAQMAYLDGVRALVRAGADVEARDRLGARARARVSVCLSGLCARMPPCAHVLSIERVPGGACCRWRRYPVVLGTCKKWNACPRARAGRAPLHIACLIPEWGDAVAAILLDAGARADALDMYDRTPLHCAAAVGALPATALLLARGAPPAPRDERGDTPLHLAAAYGRGGCAEALLRAGGAAGPDALGRTPAALAAEAGHGALAARLGGGGGGGDGAPASGGGDEWTSPRGPDDDSWQVNARAGMC
jgi:hypothetical protein